MKKKSVADRTVEHAIQNVGKGFALCTLLLVSSSANPTSGEDET